MRSLVEGSVVMVWDREVAGSIPATPTILLLTEMPDLSGILYFKLGFVLLKMCGQWKVDVERQVNRP